MKLRRSVGAADWVFVGLWFLWWFFLRILEAFETGTTDPFFLAMYGIWIGISIGYWFAAFEIWIGFIAWHLGLVIGEWAAVFKKHHGS